MLKDQFRDAILNASGNQFDDISKKLGIALGEGMLGDDDAQELWEDIAHRRHQGRIMAWAASASWKQPAPPRHRPYRQRSPDRAASIARRRQLAASGPLPPQLASCFTTGELAVLRIISDEVQAKGYCDLYVAVIAARAGTCETTVRNATREAERLALVSVEIRPQRGRKHLTNVIRIIRHEWKAWLAHHRRRRAPQIGYKKEGATVTDLLSGCDLRDRNGIWRPGQRREEVIGAT